MPHTRRKASTPKAADPNADRPYYLPADARFGGYVDLRLNEDHKSAYQTWVSDPANDWMSLMGDTLAEGMSFSCKWVAENQCFLATLSGKGISNSNERYVLTARSPDLTDAFALLLFKHYELCKGYWDDFRPSNGQLSLWG